MTDRLSSIAFRDGRESIEHQIEIHLTDLLLLTSLPPTEPPSATLGNDEQGSGEPVIKTPTAATGAVTAGRIDHVSLEEVLAGLRYVMDYRLKGGRHPHLAAHLCSRLADSLMILSREKSGSSLFGKKLTENSHEAMMLFADFLAEVAEFAEAVGNMTVTDLKSSLRFDVRIAGHSASCPEGVKEAALSCLDRLSSSQFPSFSDWRELVSVASREEVGDALRKFRQSHLAEGQVLKSQLSSIGKASPSLPLRLLFPPQGLHFDRSAERVLDMFHSSATRGLESSLLVLLREQYGRHHIVSPPPPTIFKLAFHQLTDFMVLLLIVASIASFVVDYPHYASGLVLIAVVVLNVTIGTIQEARATRAIQALLSLSVPMARVTRDGVESMLASHELLPGDLVRLDEGDAVPADLRLIQTFNFAVDESILTGESVPISKDPAAIRIKSRRLPLGEAHGNAFMGTVVTRGSALGIVVRIGASTEVGRISSAIHAAKTGKTPLQKKLARLGQALVAITLVLCVAVIVIALVQGLETKKTIQMGISLAVSVIPEGLVAVVTITLALAVGRMARLHAIVRKLPCVETLGSVTVICSDKTGTLTQGSMQMVQLWPALAPLSLSGASEGMPTRDQCQSSPVHCLAMLVCSLCHHVSSRLDTEGPSETDPSVFAAASERTWIGDPTEIALAKAALSADMDQDRVLREYGLSFEPIFEVPFDSDRKLMSRSFKVKQAGQTAPLLSCLRSTESAHGSIAGIILAKGAAETVLPKCTLRYAEGQMTVPIHEGYLQLVSDQHNMMASQGLRVLALACRSFASSNDMAAVFGPLATEASSGGCRETGAEATLAAATEKDWVFLGLVGLLDPPREGVRDLVRQSHAAGIQFIMITGDHVLTASAVAKTLGIISDTTASHPALPDEYRVKKKESLVEAASTIPVPDKLVMRGRDLDLLNATDLQLLKPFPRVFARVSPDHKLAIVKALQGQGHIVSMTGDGVNDAPALKSADVGVAMALSGSEITKQAADILLADDDLATLMSAISEGRRVFDNISKFLVYLLSCNSAEIWVVGLAVCLQVASPLSSMSILWANIIADLPPSLSLGLEPPEPGILDRPPRNPVRPVLSKSLVFSILIQGFLIAALAFFPFYLFYREFGLTTATVVVDGTTAADQFLLIRSESFATLTVLQLVLVFLSRSLDVSFFVTRFSGNKWMIAAFFISLGCLLMGIYVPGLNSFLELGPIGYKSWLRILVSVVILMITSELIKLAWRAMSRQRRNKKSQEARMAA